MAATFRTSCLALCLFLAAPSGAATLSPGDIVMLGGTISSVYRVDPSTLARESITTDGLLTAPLQICAGADGRIYVTNPPTGIVAIDPETGDQSMLIENAALEGRQPLGICRLDATHLVVSAATGGRGNAALFQVSTLDGSTQRLITGGPMVRPSALAPGPDGFVYIAEEENPPPRADYPNHRGSIMRFDPSTATLSNVYVEPYLLIGPREIAVSPTGQIWTGQDGNVSQRQGYFVRTLSDGTSEVTGPHTQRSRGVAVSLDGTVYLGDCDTIGPDCYTPYLMIHPDYVDRSKGPTGDMDLVPDLTTPTLRTPWGALKARYR